MTRLHRKVQDPLRAIRLRIRRIPAPAAVKPAPPAPDGGGDLSGLILYGQA